MKKDYISPEMLSWRLNLENIMQSASITGVTGTTDNPVPIGNPTDSDGDSRRHRDIWADEEEEAY